MAYEFKGRIRKTGPLPFGGVNAYVNVPKKIVAELLEKANKKNLPIPVKGTVEGKRFATTLVRYEGTDRVYINMKIRLKSGVDIGDSTTLTLQVDKRSRIQPIPTQLSAALARNKKAKAVFATLAPSRRREILRYLNSIKTLEAMDRNVEKVIKNLTGKEVKGLHSLLPNPGGRRR